MNKKNLLFLFFYIIFYSAIPSFSQMSELEKELTLLFAEEKYEKCADKSLKYADKKEKNNPLVYLYASKACLKMFQDFDLRNEYPKSFKDALKYAGKYRKKDETGSLYNTYINHFEELKTMVLEEVENNKLTYHEKQDIARGAKKSASLMKRVNRFDPNDQGAWLLRAVLEIEKKNRMEGKKIIKKHLPLIKQIDLLESKSMVNEKDKEEVLKIKAFKDMTKMEQLYLQKGLILYATYLQQKEKFDEAKTIIEIGKPLFYNENQYQAYQYDTKFKKAYLAINN